MIDEILAHRQALTNTRKKIAKKKVKREAGIHELERIAEADIEESYVNGIAIGGLGGDRK